MLVATLAHESGAPESRAARSDVLSQAFWDAVEYASSMLAEIPGRRANGAI